MPQPPSDTKARLSERKHAFPSNMPSNYDSGVREVLNRLFGELAAERWAAEDRHKEVLARLEEHRDAYKASVADILQKNCRNIEQGNAHKSNGSDDVPQTSKYINLAHGSVASFESEGNTRNASGLAEGSKFQFGTKLSREVPSEDRGILRRARIIVNHSWCEGIVAILIMLNALVMCCELQYEGLQVGFDLQYGDIRERASSRWPAASDTFDVLDWCFGGLFLLEAISKILVLRMAYFRVFWNWLDFFCVVAFLVDKAATLWSTSVLDSEILRALRLFRLVRLVRLIRTLEHLDVLYIMTTAIKGMSMILVWSVALLTIILMTCALFLSAFLKSTYFEGVVAQSLSDTELKKHHMMYEYFGTISRCLVSMFELTLSDFPPVSRLLAEEISEWFSIMCILHKLAIGVAVIGVINGVILQETFKVALTDDMVMVRQNKRAHKRLRKKLENFFEALDIDSSGEIQFKEFMVIAGQPELRLWLESLELEVDDLLTLFLLCDGDGDGSLTLEEILHQIPRLRGAARGIDMMALRKGVPAFICEEVESSNAKPTFKWKEAKQRHPGSFNFLDS